MARARPDRAARPARHRSDRRVRASLTRFPRPCGRARPLAFARHRSRRDPIARQARCDPGGHPLDARGGGRRRAGRGLARRRRHPRGACQCRLRGPPVPPPRPDPHRPLRDRHLARRHRRRPLRSRPHRHRRPRDLHPPAGERWPASPSDLLAFGSTLTVARRHRSMIAIAWAAYSATLAAGVALALGGPAAAGDPGQPRDRRSSVDLRLGWVSALELLPPAPDDRDDGAPRRARCGARPLPRHAPSPSASLVLAGDRRARPWLPLAFGLFPLPNGGCIRGADMIPSSPSRWRRGPSTSASRFSSSRRSARPPQLGNFSASFRMIEVLTLVPGLVVGSAFPIFARAAKDDRERLGYALGPGPRSRPGGRRRGRRSRSLSALPLQSSIIGGSKFHDAAPVLAIQGGGAGRDVRLRRLGQRASKPRRLPPGSSP